MTAIAVIRTPNQIVIAADSGVVDQKGLSLSSACKIKNLGAVFAVLNGMSSHDLTGFDVFEILKMVVRDVPLQQIVESVDKLIRKPLRVALEYERTHDPVSFKKNAIDMAPLAITLARVQNRVPVMANLEFAVSSEQDDPLILNTEKMYSPDPNVPDTEYAFIFVGTSEGKEQYSRLVRQRGFLHDNKLIEITKAFVQMEIDKGLPQFGPPINILQLTRDGARWIQKSKDC